MALQLLLKWILYTYFVQIFCSVLIKKVLNDNDLGVILTQGALKEGHGAFSERPRVES